MLSKALPHAHHPPESQESGPASPRLGILTLGCIGVVYGDIGTSPLYAFREAVLQAAKGGPVGAPEVMGILSMILWELLIIVTVKYVFFLLRADNRGEGGILSLMALVQKAGMNRPILLLSLGVIGAALFYGDSIITPSISVLSAVEGLKLVTPSLEHAVLPLAMLILVLLFIVQRKGTASVSLFFGPIMTIWFLALAGLGLLWIVRYPDVLLSFNPLYAVSFVANHGWISFVVIGAVLLAVTGAEALYADLGHFGRKPIQVAWVGLVFPALVLNYLGQGALVLHDPKAIDDPFYLLAPEGFLLPLVVLATAATIIASQAVITGAYSLTRQAIQFRLFPRMEIRHTSETEEGQIYIPKVNWFLLLGVLFLCLMFRDSGALASAYGIAVTGTMIVCSMMSIAALAKIWRKGWVLATLIVAPFLGIEMIFMAANMLKFLEGGFVPLLFAAILILFMQTWVAGSRYLFQMSRRESVHLSDFVEHLDRDPPARVEGTAIFLTSDPSIAPVALTQNIRFNKMLHEHSVILTIVTAQTPRVSDDKRITIERLSSSLSLVIVSYGFMELPDIPRALVLARKHGLDVDEEQALYFVSHRTIVADSGRGLPTWQEPVYIMLAKTAAAATDFYRLPHDRVFEVGTQMGI
jgi:KUP system potassium uptake protein